MTNDEIKSLFHKLRDLRQALQRGCFHDTDRFGDFQFQIKYHSTNQGRSGFTNYDIIFQTETLWRGQDYSYKLDGGQPKGKWNFDGPWQIDAPIALRDLIASLQQELDEKEAAKRRDAERVRRANNRAQKAARDRLLDQYQTITRNKEVA